ncbi:helix-turn-helix domain-containing protein, partial [Falsihalocynthiibacter arcticus]|uniref:helix-turn-helix domain-containing protein n=2 Tax=Falsihalocynthiibacter TaxID=2854182 RepID=UPI003AB97232
MWDPSQPCKHRQSAVEGRAERVRSRLAPTLNDREEISRGLRGEMSLRSIARFLKRSAAMAQPKSIVRHDQMPQRGTHWRQVMGTITERGSPRKT